MEISQIYHECMIPENLQEHMLRVGALAEIILEGWIGEPLEKNSIIYACLLHDLAKPMNFDLAKQAKYGMSQADIKSLSYLQKKIKDDYGDDEHTATVKMCEEIGLNPKSVEIVNDLEWKYIPKLIKINKIESLIAIYCDMRVGPKGVLILSHRLLELKKRVGDDDYQEKLLNGNNLEIIIKKNVSMDLNSIKDEQLNSRFKRLLKTKI